MERFHCGVVRKLLSNVRDDDTGALNAGRFKENANITRIDGRLVVRNTVVADEGRGEYEDLSTVGRVRHGLRV